MSGEAGRALAVEYSWDLGVSGIAEKGIAALVLALERQMLWAV